MDAHESPRIQVLAVSDTGRRRRWTDAENLRIVDESHLGGSTIAEVARRHEIYRDQCFMIGGIGIGLGSCVGMSGSHR